ncbi:MAG: 3-hydroxyacyl-CoA dehydrogenase NAD-binding domain-containing protein [Ilumatobacteraceae bacterium]
MSDGTSSLPARAAIVGCGVIGAGWASRLHLRGVDISIADPSPAAADIFAEVTANAAEAWDALGIATDRRGTVAFTDLDAACADADLIVESVPERLDIKHSTLAAIDRAAPAGAIIASSTSGFTPSELATGVDGADRLIVGHPFNPVYLLPLVEVVASPATTDEVIERAKAWYRGIGMHPLHVRREIPAHIADRFLEAVWREALWLVNDGVATTEEIDDAIRYGFGLRWAQMGLFETYRIAGGVGGMRHFIAQFGEALSWPWTKLMDTPELTDELIDTIADQSDAQSGHHSIRELERIRDRNLVGFLKVLESNEWGAGTSVRALRDLAD